VGWTDVRRASVHLYACPLLWMVLFLNMHCVVVSSIVDFSKKCAFTSPINLSIFRLAEEIWETLPILPWTEMLQR